MHRFVVVHYHEIGLKKGNRVFFENRLCANIRKALANLEIPASEIRRVSGRILVQLPDSTDMTKARTALGRVFGIAHFAEAWNSTQSLEDMDRNAWDLMSQRPFESFRIDTRR